MTIRTLSLAVRKRGSSLKASFTSLLNLLNRVSSSSTYFSESYMRKKNSQFNEKMHILNPLKALLLSFNWLNSLTHPCCNRYSVHDNEWEGLFSVADVSTTPANFQLTKTITWPLHSEDGFRTGCRNVSHKQQSFLELQSPRMMIFFNQGIIGLVRYFNIHL